VGLQVKQFLPSTHYFNLCFKCVGTKNLQRMEGQRWNFLAFGAAGGRFCGCSLLWKFFSKNLNTGCMTKELGLHPSHPLTCRLVVAIYAPIVVAIYAPNRGCDLRPYCGCNLRPALWLWSTPLKLVSCNRYHVHYF